ncbi:MAG: hypothetical protein ACRDRH_26985 [Pseudonocardia sp.]
MRVSRHRNSALSFFHLFLFFWGVFCSGGGVHAGQSGHGGPGGVCIEQTHTSRPHIAR